MKPLQPNDIKGNWATLLLPINDDEGIDYGRLSDEVDYLVHAGVDGIYTNGTAGEFYTQTEDEFDQIHRLVAEKCEKYNTPFQIGASHTSPQISLSRIQRAAELKPGAIQIILADWFPLTEMEMVACLRKMADVASPIGLVLYNPPHAKKVLSPEQFGRLKKAVPQLVGIKTAGGDAAWYQQMRQYCSGLSVFVPGHHLATGISLGAAGAYSNVACLHPVGSQAWYDLIEENLDKALELESRLQYFMSGFIEPFIVKQGYANQAADKLLAVVGGWADIGSRLRWPYRWIPESEAAELRKLANDLIPELLSSEF